MYTSAKTALKRRRLRNPASTAISIIGNLVLSKSRFARCTRVALIIAINQGVFAFAPAIIGAMRDTTADYQLPFALIAVIQLLAAVIILLGRRSARAPATSP